MNSRKFLCSSILAISVSLMVLVSLSIAGQVDAVNRLNPLRGLKLNESATMAPANGVYAYINKWGSQGSGDGQFVYPHGIAIDSSGNVYVADSGNSRIQKFTSDGTFITKWGTEGLGDGQFYEPTAVAVDSSGNVYVTDVSLHRIQKFTSDGTFIRKWGSECVFNSVPPGGGCVDPDGAGPLSLGDGQFNGPYGIAVDSSGNVYVTDSGNSRIQKFTSTGTFITKRAITVPGPGGSWSPFGIAIDSSGNVYVSDLSNNRIEKYTGLPGTFITHWGTEGSGDGQFDWPLDVDVDNSGFVYVSDLHNNRIQKFTGGGTFITQWGTEGSDNGQFRYPDSVAVDSSGRVYVADDHNYRIQVFLWKLIPIKPPIAGVK